MKIKLAVLAMLSIFAIYLEPLSDWREIFEHNGKHFIWLILFFGLFVLYQKAATIRRLPKSLDFVRSTNLRLKELSSSNLTLAIIFSVFYTVGNQIHQHLSLDGFFSSFGFFKLTISFVGYGILFYALIVLLYYLIDQYRFHQVKPDKIWFSNNRRSFFVLWLLIFICWLPVLIIFYPGFFSPDSIREFQMGLGIHEFSAHHTIIHTLIMSAFIRLGAMLGSLNTGAFLYALSQMAVMSAIFSFSLNYLAYRKVRAFIRIIIFFFFAIYPVNMLLCMTGWKDVIFGGLCLLLFILLVEVFRRPDKMLATRFRMSAICLVTVLFGLFRNNAIYALILFAPFFLISLRKYWKKVIPMVLFIVFLISTFNICAYSLFHVQKTGAAEAMSVPLQQIARTVSLHGDQLTAAERNEVARFFDIDNLSERYDPYISDPVKWQSFKADAFHQDASGFFKIWLSLGLKNPNAYITSFLCNSYGYWYPNVNEGIYFLWVHPDESLPGLRVQHMFPLKDGLFFLLIDGFVRNLPVISMLSSIGLMFWFILLSVGYLRINEKNKLLLPILLPCLVWFTTLASPVYAEYRYVYGVMLCAPFIFVLARLEKVCYNNEELI